MILLNRPVDKSKLKEGQIKKVERYAWLPTMLCWTNEDSSHYPTWHRAEVIWLEKYVKTYTYWETVKSWIFRKSERISQVVLNKLES